MAAIFAPSLATRHNTEGGITNASKRLRWPYSIERTVSAIRPSTEPERGIFS